RHSVPCNLCPTLLLFRRELTRGSVELVVYVHSQRLAVGSDDYLVDANYLAVALVRLLHGVVTQLLHRDARRSRLAFLWRIAAIPFGCIGLTGRVRHAQRIPFPLIGDEKTVVRYVVQLGGSPRSRNGMRSRRTLGYARLFTFAGYRTRIGKAAVAEFEPPGISVGRDRRLRCSHLFARFLCGMLNGVIVYRFVMRTVLVG